MKRSRELPPGLTGHRTIPPHPLSEKDDQANGKAVRERHHGPQVRLHTQAEHTGASNKMAGTKDQSLSCIPAVVHIGARAAAHRGYFKQTKSIKKAAPSVPEAGRIFKTVFFDALRRRAR